MIEIRSQENELLSFKLKCYESNKIFSLMKYFYQISHDTKNQLGVILAGLQLSKSANKENTELSQIIDMSVNSVSAISNSYTDLQMIKQMEIFNPSESNPIHSINEAVELIKFKFPNSESKIQIRNISDESESVMDSDLLAQAFYHVMENSVEFSNTQADISITLKNENQNYSVCFSDKGNRIHPNVIENLKKPFNTTKTKSGAGLGLLFANYTAKIHGGILNITSDNMGTSVFFILPIVKK